MVGKMSQSVENVLLRIKCTQEGCGTMGEGFDLSFKKFFPTPKFFDTVGIISRLKMK